MKLFRLTYCLGGPGPGGVAVHVGKDMKCRIKAKDDYEAEKQATEKMLRTGYRPLRLVEINSHGKEIREVREYIDFLLK